MKFIQKDENVERIYSVSYDKEKLIELLDERSITHNNGKISLPKALILQKRINKKPF